MPGPPTDVTPSDLMLQLLERPRPADTIDFPGLDRPGQKGRIRIQVLAKEQHDRARLVAQQSLKKNAHALGISSLTPEDMRSEAVQGVIADLASCEVLAMACTQTEPIAGSDEENGRYPYVFADGAQVGKTLTADEVAYLFSAYTLVQHRYGPHEAICSDEDINAWVRRLAGGAADFPFLRLSSPQWGELLMSFAARLSSLSGILESQWESLPESLRSDLQMFCLGTGSSSEPAENGSDSAELPGNGAEISFEQAVRFANQKLGRE